MRLGPHGLIVEETRFSTRAFGGYAKPRLVPPLFRISFSNAKYRFSLPSLTCSRRTRRTEPATE